MRNIIKTLNLLQAIPLFSIHTFYRFGFAISHEWMKIEAPVSIYKSCSFILFCNIFSYCCFPTPMGPLIMITFIRNFPQYYFNLFMILFPTLQIFTLSSSNFFCQKIYPIYSTYEKNEIFIGRKNNRFNYKFSMK